MRRGSVSGPPERKASRRRVEAALWVVEREEELREKEIMTVRLESSTDRCHACGLRVRDVRGTRRKGQER